VFPLRPGYQTPWSGSVAILSPGYIPTVDYYLMSRIRGGGQTGAITHWDSRKLDGTGRVALPSGTFVVIVRHAAIAWLKWLHGQRERLSGVAFLMDDDIPRAWRCPDVPLDYGVWTSGRYLLTRRWLARVCDRLWVSTEALRSRYPVARLAPPLWFGEGREPAPVGTRRWGYHGTRVHKEEMRWLVPVVEAVQQRVPEAEFEVFGGRKIERMFSHIPRAKVLKPLPWNQYRDYAYASDLAIGVAPMLSGKFNSARSHTKAFDIIRCGATGIFSAREPYVTTLGESGALFLSDDRDRWVSEIIRLLQNDAERIDRFRMMRRWVERMCVKEGMAQLINKNRSAGQ